MVETDEHNSISYMERWRTRAALDRHLRSALYCRVLEAMELSRIPPKIEFYEIADIGGLDLIERVRLDLMPATAKENVIFPRKNSSLSLIQGNGEK